MARPSPQPWWTGQRDDECDPGHDRLQPADTTGSRCRNEWRGADRDSGAMLIDIDEQGRRQQVLGHGDVGSLASGRWRAATGPRRWAPRIDRGGGEVAQEIPRCGLAVGGPVTRDPDVVLRSVPRGRELKIRPGPGTTTCSDSPIRTCTCRIFPNQRLPTNTRATSLSASRYRQRPTKVVAPATFNRTATACTIYSRRTPPRAPEATGEHRYNPELSGQWILTFPAAVASLLEAGMLMLAHNQNDTSNTHLPYGLRDVRNNPSASKTRA